MAEAGAAAFGGDLMLAVGLDYVGDLRIGTGYYGNLGSRMTISLFSITSITSDACPNPENATCLTG